MNIQSQSALLAAFINLMLALSIFIRWRWVPVNVYYMLLALNLSAWTFANFMGDLTRSARWDVFGGLAAVLIPLTGLKFFQTFLDDQSALAERALRFTTLSTVVLLVALLPLSDERLFQVGLFVYVFAALYLCVYLMWRRLRSLNQPVESARLLALTIGGLVVITLSMADFVPTLKTTWPALGNIPVLGNVVIMVFMFFLYQVILEYRLLGLSELVGKIAVLAALVMLLAAIYGVLAVWIGDEPSMFGFYTLLVSFVVLVIFEPMKAFIEERVNRALFRERFEFARQLAMLRREMANVVEVEELSQLIISRLEDTRRITHASLYLLEDDATGYRRVSAVGEAPERLDAVMERVFLERLGAESALSRVDFEETLAERLNDHGEDAVSGELRVVVEVMTRLSAAVSVPILSHDRVVGVFNVNNERVREPYTAEELRSLVQIAAQAAIGVENSRLVAALRERDRLAALGEMAAGLAHEIRNPLGAIKGAAQLLDLSTLEGEQEDEDSPQAFLDIIIEEVGRLNNVVSQFLDYARPYKGEPRSGDVNHVVTRTEALLRHHAEAWGVEVVLELDDALPEARMDPERLRQVFLNLGINAIQATGTPPPEASPEDEAEQAVSGAASGAPRLVIRTTQARRVLSVGSRMLPREVVEVQFSDNGRGIPAVEQDRVFIPFFTTKNKGTGLGLAISQRIVENLGGRLEFSSREGHGTTFRVLLPLGDASVA